MSLRHIPISSALLLTVAATVVACGSPSSEPATGSKAGAPPSNTQTNLPTLRPGVWLTTTVMGDGTRDENEECIEADTPPLAAIGAPDLSQCSRKTIRHVADGYVVDVSCSSDGIVMALKGSIRGNMQTEMTSDLELGLGAEGAPLETTRLHSEGRYVGPCPAA